MKHFLFGFIGTIAIILVYLALIIWVSNIEPNSTRVPSALLENCFEVELESRKSYHRVPNEILTYCLEKNRND